MATANILNRLCNEVVAFACDAGVVLITRAEMQRLARMEGHTLQTAQFMGFGGPVFDPATPCPLVSGTPLTADEAFALVYGSEQAVAA